MMIDYAEFRDWIDTLYRHPEWRQELRRLVLTDEILELPQLVRELVEAQKRTEQRVEELAEAQKRTEERVGRLEIALAELAEAQKRTEERVGRLEIALAELAEAQKRTEQRVDRLAEEQQKLWVAVGGLQRIIGASVEDEAAGVAEVVLRRKGYRILQPGFSLPLDGEIDVVLPLEDATGQRIWAMVEAKARLTARDVRAWSQRMRDRVWQERLKEKGFPGPYLVYAYGIRIDLGALETAEKEGIGLLKGDGEVSVPQGLIEPSVE
ncbi:MAG: hypothetical protein ANABAC_3375 [Anaerolineae bacterium]|jgi:seryl-tRNA synthetase|nr:MAG: hypothetical protein ANABAC_3375 [Anaerolineae bacterium]